MAVALRWIIDNLALYDMMNRYGRLNYQCQVCMIERDNVEIIKTTTPAFG